MRASALVLVVSFAACQPYAVLTVEDPRRLAERAVALGIGEDPTALTEIPLEGQGFPLSISLTSDLPADRPLWVDALDEDGVALARGQVSLAFAYLNRTPRAVSLDEPCEGADFAEENGIDERCEDGAFCNGAERCAGRVCQRGRPPCGVAVAGCVNVACVETARSCDELADHSACSDDGSRVCHPREGCVDAAPCEDDESCDDGFLCNGVERCEAGRCSGKPGPAQLIATPCLQGACTESGGVVGAPLPNGTSCDEARVCVDGACVDEALAVVTAPPFLLRDVTSGHDSFTARNEVAVDIAPSSAAAWLLTEDDAPPASDDARFALVLPTRFELSAGTGRKTVRLWVRSTAGTLSAAPTLASIQLSESVLTVGPTQNSCPAETSTPCAADLANDSDALATALGLAQAGDTVLLYGGPGGAPVVYASAVVPVAVLIEPAPGFGPEDVVVENVPESPLRLAADDVVLRGFTLRARRSSRHAIRARTDDDAPTHGHVLERMILEALIPGTNSNNGLEYALALGDSLTVRDSWIYGWWESIVPADFAFADFTFVQNTVVLFEARPLPLEDSTRAHIRNNIFYLVNPFEMSGPQFLTEGSTDLTLDGNLVRGWPLLTAVGAPGGANTLTDPGFVRLDRPELALGSPAIGAALSDDASGPFDLWGNPRPQTNASVGAVEPAASPPSPISSVLRVGLSAAGCPVATSGTCDVWQEVVGDEAINRAVARAFPGSTIEVYGAPGQLHFTDVGVVVDRQLTLRRAPGEAPGAVILEASISTGDAPGVITLTNADDVVVEGLTIRLQGSGDGVYVDPTDRGGAVADSAAERARLDRLVVEGLDASRPARAGFRLGFGSTLTSSLVFGSTRRLANAADVSDVTIVGSTHLTIAPTESGSFDLTDAANVTLANNLIDRRTTPLPARYGVTGAETATGAVYESNQFFGVRRAGSVDGYVGTPISTPPGTNCTTPADLTGFDAGPGPDGGTVDAGAPAPDTCAGEPDYAAAAAADYTADDDDPHRNAGDGSFADSAGLDVLDRPRVQGAAVDVGAFERD